MNIYCGLCKGTKRVKKFRISYGGRPVYSIYSCIPCTIKIFKFMDKIEEKHKNDKSKL